jgi:hypothetical protein
MMDKSVIKKYSSVFLSTLLVAGIFAVSSLSFMMESQAQQEYGTDNYKKKVIVEKRECNNGNFNLEILNDDIIPEVAKDLFKLTEPNNVQNEEPNNWALDDDSLTVICTNYNDPVKFSVKQQPEQNERSSTEQTEMRPLPQPEVVVSCTDCLEKLGLSLQEQLIASIASLSNPIIQLGGVTLDFTGITETSTLSDVCDIIDAAVEDDGPISLTEITRTINDLLPNLDSEEQDQTAEALLCLLKTKILENDAGMM